jgi:uncharacterized protein YjfI (DUF2170 family)
MMLNNLITATEISVLLHKHSYGDRPLKLTTTGEEKAIQEILQLIQDRQEDEQ